MTTLYTKVTTGATRYCHCSPDTVFMNCSSAIMQAQILPQVTSGKSNCSAPLDLNLRIRLASELASRRYSLRR
jgi:hypothetical protein